MNNRYWKIIKRKLVIFTAIIGIITPIICYYLLPSLNILLEPLSKFGVASETKYIWNFFLVTLSIMLHLTNNDLIDDIKENIVNYQYKLLTVVNLISSVSLALTGLIDMETKLLHLGFATIFFLSYTGFIFWWGFLNIKYDLRKAIASMIISILIILSAITSIKYLDFGYGVFEVIFITLIIIWNIKSK